MSLEWMWKPSVYILESDLKNAKRASPSTREYVSEDDDEMHPLAYLKYRNIYEEDDEK